MSKDERMPQLQLDKSQCPNADIKKQVIQVTLTGNMVDNWNKIKASLGVMQNKSVLCILMNTYLQRGAE